MSSGSWGWDEAEQKVRFATTFDPSRYRVVIVAGEVVGAVAVEWREDVAFLGDIEIAPAWRGCGLGTAVIRRLMREAELRGLPVALQVLQGNPARRLYERLGFVGIGETATHDLMRWERKPAVGLQRGIVRLAPHHPEWAALFAVEAQRIREAFAGRALAIEHVGSTAVAGLRAKPILDIMVGVAALDDVEETIRDLERIGYERRPAGDLPGRRYLVLGRGEVRQVHLSLSEPASAFWRDHLLFRDRLRADPETAAAYERLKEDLAVRFPDDRISYTEGKDAFISAVLAATRTV